MPERDFSLREKKRAQTKLALMNAFVARLRHASFEKISVKEVCGSLDISEGTFFNYFPEKIDIINYYVTLMTMKVAWRARKKAFKRGYIALLNAFFGEMADGLAGIDIEYEIISILVVQHEKLEPVAISNIEKRLAFPGLAGLEEVAPLPIGDFFKECIEGARNNGELPAGVSVVNALVSLMTIIVGTMIAVKFCAVKNIKHQYLRQLQVLWTELGVRKQKGYK